MLRRRKKPLGASDFSGDSHKVEKEEKTFDGPKTSID